MTRRDYTNAEGYICPTENSAVRNVDRGYTAVYTAPVKPPKTKVLREKQAPPPPKPKDENLKRVRQMYSALCCIAVMMDISIDSITLKCKGDPGRYSSIGDKKAIEREP